MNLARGGWEFPENNKHYNSNVTRKIASCYRRLERHIASCRAPTVAIFEYLASLLVLTFKLESETNWHVLPTPRADADAVENTSSHETAP